MKKSMTFLFLPCICFVSMFGFSLEGERFLQSEQAVREAAYGHIDAKALKALLETQTFFTLLDARGEEWHDGFTIPGAILASYQNSSEDFETIIPDKESLVIVYCFSFSCPLSPRLAQKLADLGYTHVLEYPAGLKEWRDIANYPVVPIS